MSGVTPREVLPPWLQNYPPLFDPARLLGRCFGIVAAVNGVMALIGALSLLGTPSSEQPLDPWLWAIVAVLSVVLPLGAYRLVCPRQPANAFYLRSFRSDRHTHALRVLLKGVLGPTYRLSGIRPPAHRGWTLVNGALAVWTALRYAGSKYMELEAGDDWMARLVASYRHTRVMFVDVRDLTEHVEREVRLSFRCAAADRTIFVCDARQAEPAWRGQLGQFLGLDAGAAERLRLVTVMEDESATAAAVQRHLTALPPGACGFSVEGIRYVREWIPDDVLRREARRRPDLQLLAGFLLTAGVATILPFLPVMQPARCSSDPSAWRAVPLAVNVLLAILWVSALARLTAEGRALRRWAGVRRRTAYAAPVLALLVGLLSIGTLIMQLTLPILAERARVATAQAQVRMMEAALEMFNLDANRYPSTDEGLAVLERRPAHAGRDTPYLGRSVPLDPWCRPYRYRSPGPDGRPFELFSESRPDIRL